MELKVLSIHSTKIYFNSWHSTVIKVMLSLFLQLKKMEIKNKQTQKQYCTTHFIKNQKEAVSELSVILRISLLLTLKIFMVIIQVIIFQIQQIQMTQAVAWHSIIKKANFTTAIYRRKQVPVRCLHPSCHEKNCLLKVNYWQPFIFGYLFSRILQHQLCHHAEFLDSSKVR